MVDDGDGDGAEDRPWLLHCLREKRLGPKKVAAMMEAVPMAERSGLHGFILAASSEVSAGARDAFRAKCRAMGFAEAHLWGRKELEALLQQPRNNHLAFAYTGVSPMARRRANRRQLISRLAMKQLAHLHLSAERPVLVRDPEDDRYPWLDDDAGEGRARRGHWRILLLREFSHEGLCFTVARHFAYLDDDGAHWDFAEGMNDAQGDWDDPWDQAEDADEAARGEAEDVWNDLPAANRAWFERQVVLPYERIVAIDPDGDEFFDGPHLYAAPFDDGQPPFLTGAYEDLETIGDEPRQIDPDPADRVTKFPRTTG